MMDVQILERRSALMLAAEERGLLGAKGRQIGGRFSEALVAAASSASGITESTELLTYALLKVALEDDYGDLLLARKGKVAKGTFHES